MYTNKKSNFHTLLATIDSIFLIPVYVVFVAMVVIGCNVKESNILYIENLSLAYMEILIFNAVLAFNLVFKFGGFYNLFLLATKYHAYVENDFLISKRNLMLNISRTTCWTLWLVITSLYCIGELDPSANLKFADSFTTEFLGLSASCIILYYVTKIYLAHTYKRTERDSFIYKDEKTLSYNVTIGDIENEYTAFDITANFLYFNENVIVARYSRK